MLVLKQSISSTEFNSIKFSIKLMDLDLWALIEHMSPKQRKPFSVPVYIA